MAGPGVPELTGLASSKCTSCRLKHDRDGRVGLDVTYLDVAYLGVVVWVPLGLTSLARFRCCCFDGVSDPAEAIDGIVEP